MGAERKLGGRRCRLCARYTTAAMVVLVLSFQLSRFFLTIPLESFACYESNPGAGESASGNHHDHAAAETLSRNSGSGNSIQHCKDTYDGAVLNPIPPVRLPVAVKVEPAPDVRWAGLPAASRAPADQSLTPPFQPPRSLL